VNAILKPTRAIMDIRHRLAGVDTRRRFGPVLSVGAVSLNARFPGLSRGEMCELRDADGALVRRAEVVAIEEDVATLAPYGSTAGLSTNLRVFPTDLAPAIEVGAATLGSLVDPFGGILQRLSAEESPVPGLSLHKRPLRSQPIDPVQRRMIRDRLPTGIRVLDGFIPLGIGQRVGVFGSPGAGKSSLLGQMIKGTAADVIVIGLIGERGREVGEFLELLEETGRSDRCTVVVATSDRSASERIFAALAATSVAEAYRDCGLNVLLLIDSTTRFARAMRELGLSAGEPATRRGYTPSVFDELPKLVERPGLAVKGSITAIYTVLVEGEIASDPVAEEIMSLLDGHVILSNKLGAAGHYPAVDVLRSRSRLAGRLLSEDEAAAAARVRSLIARYEEIELLVQIGEYRPGSDPEADAALRLHGAIQGFLRQSMAEMSPLEKTWADLLTLARS